MSKSCRWYKYNKRNKYYYIGKFAFKAHRLIFPIVHK
jgi:hypothetical protein